MKVALIKDIPNLGKKGDIKDVSDGYGRNFLLRNKLADILTPSIEKKIKSEHEKQNRIDASLKEQSELLKKKIQNLNLIFEINVGKSNRAFGSITPSKIINELKKYEINLEKEQISAKPIKTLGNSLIKVKLYPGIEAFLNISIRPESDKKIIKKH